MASIPFSASQHGLKPSDRKADASSFRIGALSSTTKTVLPSPRLRGSVSTSKSPSFRRRYILQHNSNGSAMARGSQSTVYLRFVVNSRLRVLHSRPVSYPEGEQPMFRSITFRESAKGHYRLNVVR